MNQTSFLFWLEWCGSESRTLVHQGDDTMLEEDGTSQRTLLPMECSANAPDFLAKLGFKYVPNRFKLVFKYP